MAYIWIANTQREIFWRNLIKLYSNSGSLGKKLLWQYRYFFFFFYYRSKLYVLLIIIHLSIHHTLHSAKAKWGKKIYVLSCLNIWQFLNGSQCKTFSYIVYKKWVKSTNLDFSWVWNRIIPYILGENLYVRRVVYIYIRIHSPYNTSI